MAVGVGLVVRSTPSSGDPLPGAETTPLLVVSPDLSNATVGQQVTASVYVVSKVPITGVASYLRGNSDQASSSHQGKEMG
jgi:hypothetical protein